MHWIIEILDNKISPKISINVFIDQELYILGTWNNPFFDMYINFFRHMAKLSDILV